MQITKHVHATVAIEDAGRRILIDPGAFTPDAADLLASATSVLITHEHFDHFAVDEVRAALAARYELRVWGPASVTAALDDTDAARAGRVVTVRGGEALDIDGIEVQVHGGDHGQIHDGITVPHNVGYLVGGRVFHPGDSYTVPPVPVDTLLVPVSGPWVKIGDAIDFISAVAPRQTVQIHDVMLSEIGRASTAMFLGGKGLAATPMLVLEPDESVEI